MSKCLMPNTNNSKGGPGALLSSALWVFRDSADLHALSLPECVVTVAPTLKHFRSNVGITPQPPYTILFKDLIYGSVKKVLRLQNEFGN